MASRKPSPLKVVFDRLYAAFGPQHWWPGDTPFEVMIGAILTQNTNWTNVERAIQNIKKEKLLTPVRIRSIRTDRLARLIRPAGYFNIKAKRIKNFLSFWFSQYQGKLSSLKREDPPVLRDRLLAVNGIGPETADSILLYALEKPVFVVDAYTRRVLSRHGLIPSSATYQDIQQLFLQQLQPDVPLYNECHALIVRLGKEFCRPQPRCAQCPLNTWMIPSGWPYGRLLPQRSCCGTMAKRHS